MTITRPRILLFVLLLALVGVLAVVWRPLWLAVAYKYRCSPYATVDVRYEKRLPALPGPDIIWPPQECPSCYFAQRPEEFQQALQATSARLKHVNMRIQRAEHSTCFDEPLLRQTVTLSQQRWMDAFPLLSSERVVHAPRCSCAANDHKGAP